MSQPIPYKISTLIYIQNTAGDLLLMQRKKAPNFGLWSSIGGKLEMATGESPYQTAIREVQEEIGLCLTEADLHLFAIIAEKAYEGHAHWLMFLFDCRKRLSILPTDIAEGAFAFHPQSAIASLPVPETDRLALWPLWFEKRQGFTSLRADCAPGKPIEITVEEEW
ncbi:MAG: NUDIX domain-containing protein [Verrucomicrobiota bacterium]|nr:NUDIX domain-containing protein [Verrucomicrobiota bacterium]